MQRRARSLWYLAAVPLSLTGCCRDEILDEASAPSGDRVATLFVRDCGATADYSTQVALRSGHPSTGKREVIFVSDSDHGAAPRGSGGGPPAAIQWRGSDTLVIQHHPRARVFRQIEAHEGVSIRYAPLP